MTADPERTWPMLTAELRDAAGPSVVPQPRSAHRIAVIDTDQGPCEVWATADRGVLTHNEPRAWGDGIEGDMAALDFSIALRHAVEARMRYRATGAWT